MKPIYLKFKGLNSFSEQAEIDFSKTTQSGIFGIFGDTGSGKSTILDAINFALYGEVDRSKEKTDVINYNSDGVEVQFTFDVTNCGVCKNYLVERSIKKKSGTHKATLYEQSGKESVCIADNASSVKEKIIEIIGVQAEDFRKCIALPQGEFATFVQSKASDRINLIERLFNLSKYGGKLKDKLRALEIQTDREYENIRGELSAYAEVSKDAIKQVSEELNSAKLLLVKLTEENQKLSTELDGAKKLFENKKQLDNARAALSKLQSNSLEMEKLRKNLDRLPDCRRICDESLSLNIILSKLNSDKELLKKLIADSENFETVLKKCKNDIDGFNYEAKVNANTQKQAELSAFGDKFITLGNLELKIGAVKKEISRHSEKMAKAQSEVDKDIKAINYIKEQLNAIPETNLRDFFFGELKDVITCDVYVNEFDYLCNIKSGLENFKAETKLYKYIDAELSKRIEYLEGLIREYSPKTLINVEERVNEIQKNTEKREYYLTKLNSGDIELAKNRNDLALVEERLNASNKELEEKTAEYISLLDELSKKYGEKPDYSKISVGLVNEKKELDIEFNKLKRAREINDDNLKKTLAEIAATNTLIATLTVDVENRKNILNGLLSHANFASVDECKRLIDEFGDYASAQKTLKEYDAQRQANLSAIDALVKIEGIEEITEQKVKEISVKKLGGDRALSEARANITVKDRALSDLNIKLARKNEINKRLKCVNEKRNLIGQLRDLIKNNKFMEFVAEGHLIEISAIASKTLLDLTDGRYFLIYNDGFFVGDNFNAGKNRGVNTLSGGETFLVSLSLALALSSVICARSNKNIEFFFLDEGFGTLDETLIDVVMNALEKLKSANFTIGIISHVEELKHRIESKIIVNKATESHGSTITVCC